MLAFFGNISQSVNSYCRCVDFFWVVFAGSTRPKLTFRRSRYITPISANCARGSLLHGWVPVPLRLSRGVEPPRPACATIMAPGRLPAYGGTRWSRRTYSLPARVDDRAAAPLLLRSVVRGELRGWQVLSPDAGPAADAPGRVARVCRLATAVEDVHYAVGRAGAVDLTGRVRAGRPEDMTLTSNAGSRRAAVAFKVFRTSAAPYRSDTSPTWARDYAAHRTRRHAAATCFASAPNASRRRRSCRTTSTYFVN